MKNIKILDIKYSLMSGVVVLGRRICLLSRWISWGFRLWRMRLCRLRVWLWRSRNGGLYSLWQIEMDLELP